MGPQKFEMTVRPEKLDFKHTLSVADNKCSYSRTQVGVRKTSNNFYQDGFALICCKIAARLLQESSKKVARKLQSGTDLASSKNLLVRTRGVTLFPGLIFNINFPLFALSAIFSLLFMPTTTRTQAI